MIKGNLREFGGVVRRVANRLEATTLLLRSIWLARKRGLLRLRRVSVNTNFACLRTECPRNCCWVFEEIVVDDEDLRKLPPQGVDMGGLPTLRRKSSSTPSGSSCVFLQNGECSTYNNRPSACREYPWYRFDDALYVDRGCPGVSITDGGEQPPLQALGEASRYFSIIPRPLRSLVLKYLKTF